MPYIPDGGDIVWLDFSPQAGHEQAGRKPAIMLSPESYNRRAGLCLVAPITARRKGYPFEAILPASCKTTGVVLCDQIRNVDWQARESLFEEKAGQDFARAVSARFLPLVTW
jgi:mRNA interferase MazF